jgi:CRP-like cAMP-binding protein
VDDVLSKAPLFSALDEEAADALRASMVELRLERGQVLFNEGDLGDRLYVVVSGKVKLRRTSADGRENVLAIIGPGEMFGELSIFDPGPRSSTAVAIIDVSLLELGQAEVRAWLVDRPEVAESLLHQLAQRLRHASEQMADLVFTDVPGRVAKALLDLSRRFGRQDGENIRVDHDLTQEELAQLVGASRETVNKALADFAARGWIRLDARSVILIDVERLTHRAR